MEKSAGKIRIDIVTNEENFNRQIKGIEKLAQKTGKVIAAAFASKQIYSFGKACTELASDLAEVQNVVDVTFPNMAKKINDFAKEAAESIGTSETMAKKFAGTFGAMAKAFGFAESEAADMSIELTKLAGDVASFYNLTQDEAYTKLKSVFTGETESLKDLGVVMTQSALDSYALANGFGKTTSAMTEAEKVALRYAFVQEKLSAASGDFARTSDGWANQLRVLNLQFDTLKATIGEGLIAALTPVIQVINIVIARLITLANYFSRFTKALFGGSKEADKTATSYESIEGSISNATKGLEEMASTMKKTLGLAGFDELNVLNKQEDSGSSAAAGTAGVSLAGIEGISSTENIETELTGLEVAALKIREKFLNLKKFFVENKDQIIAVIAGLVAGITTYLAIINFANFLSKAKKAFSGIKAAFSLLGAGFSGPALLIAAAVGLIVAGIVDLWNTSETFRENVKKCWTMISTAFTTAWKLIWNNGLQPMIKKLVELGQVIYQIYEESGLKTIFEFVITGIMAVASALLSALALAIATIVSIISNCISAVITVLTGAVEVIAMILYSLWEVIINTLKVSVEIIVSIVSKCISVVVAVLSSFAEVIAMILYSLWEIIVNTLKITVEIIIGIITTTWNVITTMVQLAVQFLIKLFETLISFITNMVLIISKAVVEGISFLGAKIKEFCDACKAIWQAFKQATIDLFTAMWNALINTLTNTINNILAKVSMLVTKWTISWTALKSAIVAVFLGIWNSIKYYINLIIGGIETMVNYIINGVNHAIQALNNLSFEIPDWKIFGDLAGTTFGLNLPSMNTISLPRLAQGGYVKANTPQLAMIGDNKRYGEIVTPENKMYEITYKSIADFMRMYMNQVGMQNNNAAKEIKLVVSGELAPFFRWLKIELDKENARVGTNFEVVYT